MIDLDRLTADWTSFPTFAALVAAGVDGYAPTLVSAALADAFDLAMVKSGTHVRAFRKYQGAVIKERTDRGRWIYWP